MGIGMGAVRRRVYYCTLRTARRYGGTLSPVAVDSR
jgi:hypothetical protein